jgi:hypothetical protein
MKADARADLAGYSPQWQKVAKHRENRRKFLKKRIAFENSIAIFHARS